MEHWIIVALGILLVLLFMFKSQSFASALSPSPAPAPAPAPAPVAASRNWTQTMIIPSGGNCEPGWTKIGKVTCAK